MSRQSLETQVQDSLPGHIWTPEDCRLVSIRRLRGKRGRRRFQDAVLLEHLDTMPQVPH